MKIGICGLGVVGGAIARAFQRRESNTVIGYDIDPQKKGSPLPALLDCEVIFLCLPTPTRDGKQDLTALTSVLAVLSRESYPGAVCIKSTVLPGTTKRLQGDYPNLALAHNPEFLTERRPLDDFLEQESVLVGTALGSAFHSILNAYHTILSPFTPVKHYQDPTVTEMAKYIHNCFLAAKVGLMNEFHSICSALGISYAETIAAALTQGKIAPSHTKVPGPDGKLGYGGMCFPKDVNAFTAWAKESGHPAVILESVRNQNRLVRGDE